MHLAAHGDVAVLGDFDVAFGIGQRAPIDAGGGAASEALVAERHFARRDAHVELARHLEAILTDADAVRGHAVDAGRGGEGAVLVVDVDRTGGDEVDRVEHVLVDRVGEPATRIVGDVLDRVDHALDHAAEPADGVGGGLFYVLHHLGHGLDHRLHHVASGVGDIASGVLHEIDNVIEPAHDIPPFQDLTSEYGSPRGASPGAFPVLESRL